jgi:5-methylcytosine-specific restriction endonuclease McrA
MNEQINSTESTDVKPCRKCGARERNKRGACIPCKRQALRKWRETNPNKVRDLARKYREASPEKHREYYRKWQAANPEKVREHDRKRYYSNLEKERERGRKWKAANIDRVLDYARKWKIANPDKHAVMQQNRRARTKGNGGTLSKDIVERLMIAQGGKCACCGADLKQTGYHLDHIMPIALGGLNDDSNVQLLTPKCNLRKGAMHPDDWKRLAS